MTKSILRLGFCSLALSLAACGDVLSGTWVNNSLPSGLSSLGIANGTTYKSTLVITGKTVTDTTSLTAPASAGAAAGCTTTSLYSGTFTTSNGTSITFNFTSGTITVAGCTNAAGNQASTQSTVTELQTANQASSGSYVALDKKLTITGSINSIPIENQYTKQ